MNLNVAHVHLLLNHFPTVGLVVALSLLLVALAKGDSALERIGLGLLVVISLVTLPAYISGNAADIAIAGFPDVSATMVLEHHDAALLAFALMAAVAEVDLLLAGSNGDPELRQSLATVRAESLFNCRPIRSAFLEVEERSTPTSTPTEEAICGR